MSRAIRSAVPILFCLTTACFSAPALAHTDDPKVRDKQPPYAGKGYIASRSTESGLQFQSQGVTLMSWIALNEFSPIASSGNTCWGYVSPAGREYAIMGLSNGTAFVEITDPAGARQVGFVSGPLSMWRDMKTYQHYCYAVSEGGGGIQVIDLSQIDQGVVRHLGNRGDSSSASTHTMFIDETSGVLYRCGGGFGGLRMYSLADPVNPALVGTLPGRYVHECQVITYSSGPMAGRQIAYLCGGLNSGFSDTALDVVDVTDKQNPTLLRRVYWPLAGYSHQIWLTPDRSFGYLNDEFDESVFGLPSSTIMVDVANPAQATYVGTFNNGNPAIGHNLYTRGNRIFEANYRSGLRVFDATNPRQPVEVAWFDTYPDDDDPFFNGLWGNFPFFPSGTVIGSDIERGLFVWYIGAPQITFSYPSPLPSLLNPIGGTVDVRITPQAGVSIQPGSESLNWDDGSGTLRSSALTPLGGGLYRAAFPTLPCDRTISYFFSARALGGSLWRDPLGASHTARAAASVAIRFDDFQVPSGWTAGAADDDATGGVWTRGDPIGTGTPQPDEDFSAVGTNCWFTGQGVAGGGVDAADVDGGKTTLLSPVFDLSSAQRVRVSYWRWYFGGFGYPTHDALRVEVSRDGGANWALFETVGPGGPDASGAQWRYKEAQLTDIIPLSSSVRFRFIASDLLADSTVEAALDDFQLDLIDCGGPCPADLNNDRRVNEADLGILLQAWQSGGGGDLDGDNDTDESDLGMLLQNWNAPC